MITHSCKEYRFDPPLCIPPNGGTASVDLPETGDFATVTVRDGEGRVVGCGSYHRVDAGSTTFKLISGTAWNPAKAAQ